MSEEIDFQILDADGEYLRSVKEGELTLRYGGWGQAWIPDRKPGEATARLVKEDGTLLAVAELTDNHHELSIRFGVPESEEPR